MFCSFLRYIRAVASSELHTDSSPVASGGDSVCYAGSWRKSWTSPATETTHSSTVSWFFPLLAPMSVAPPPKILSYLRKSKQREIVRRNNLELYKEELHSIEGMLEKLTAKNAAVQELRQMRGIATNTASKMIAEIIDIRRFAREDSLACYSGLGLQEYSTGQTTSMISLELFNDCTTYYPYPGSAGHGVHRPAEASASGP